MLILICGDYKTGKSVSASTFPKPMLYEDWDNGFRSIRSVNLNKDISQVDVISFYKKDVYDLSFRTEIGEKVAPAHTKEAPILVQKHNEIVRSLKQDGCYNGRGPYKTLVIDSLTSMFQVWKEACLKINGVSTLRIPDYGTLETNLIGVFIPTLYSLLGMEWDGWQYVKVETKCTLEYVVVIDHIDSEKDEITGAVSEFPIGPSKAQGRVLGRHFDEIYRQIVMGGQYTWQTRKTGLLNAGSRMNLPEKITPATFQELSKYLPKPLPKPAAVQLELPLSGERR